MDSILVYGYERQSHGQPPRLKHSPENRFRRFTTPQNAQKRADSMTVETAVTFIYELKGKIDSWFQAIQAKNAAVQTF